jgi:hypothetical protein
MYVKAEGDTVVRYPYSLSTLAQDHPQVSFPRAFSADMLAGFGVYPVEEAPAPDHDPVTQNAVLRQAPERIAGAWTLYWDVTAKTKVEAQHYRDRTAAEQRAARDAALSACDWVIVKHLEAGSPVPDAWVEYRQALRDLPAQPGFPFTLTWPVEPE